MTTPEGVSPLVTGICRKLDLTIEALNSLYAAGPVDGWVGSEVAQMLAERYAIDLTTERLALGLLDRGVLTAAEADWLEE